MEKKSNEREITLNLSDYTLIRQGEVGNDLAKTNETKDNTKYNTHGNKIITVDNFKVLIRENNVLNTIRTSTRQLLDFIIYKITQDSSSFKIFFSISDYMKFRGTKNIDTLRRDLKEDLELLYNISISYKDKKGNFGDIRIISKKEIRNGVVYCSIGIDFFEHLLTYRVMPYPLLLGKINGHKNPHAYCILRKLLEHKNMNYFKNNSNTIGVKSLLEAVESIPKYLNLDNNTRQVGKRIILPFIRDLLSLDNVLSFEFYNSAGKLKLNDVKKLKYNEFISLNIKIKWKNYPLRRNEKFN